MNNFKQTGNVINLTPSASVTAGVGHRFGTGLFGVASNTCDSTAAAPFVVEGIVSLAKGTSVVAVGDRIDWDSANSNVKKHDSTAATALCIGVATTAGDSTATSVEVKLGLGGAAGSSTAL